MCICFYHTVHSILLPSLCIYIYRCLLHYRSHFFSIHSAFVFITLYIILDSLLHLSLQHVCHCWGFWWYLHSLLFIHPLFSLYIGCMRYFLLLSLLLFPLVPHYSLIPILYHSSLIWIQMAVFLIQEDSLLVLFPLWLNIKMWLWKSIYSRLNRRRERCTTLWMVSSNHYSSLAFLRLWDLVFVLFE